MEMVECGAVGANWHSRKLKICHEMAQEFADLYRDYGDRLQVLELQPRGSGADRSLRRESVIQQKAPAAGLAAEAVTPVTTRARSDEVDVIIRSSRQCGGRRREGRRRPDSW
jgi:hypothetical protein